MQSSPDQNSSRALQVSNAELLHLWSAVDQMILESQQDPLFQAAASGTKISYSVFLRRPKFYGTAHDLMLPNRA